jgi:hypothetical protein
MLARMEGIFDDNRKKTEDNQKVFLARMDAIHEKRMAMLRYQSDTDESMFWTDRGRQMETNTKEHEALLERQRIDNEDTAIHSVKDDQNEMNAYDEATEEIEQDTGMMQYVEEHQDVPIEEVAMMPVKGLKKRRRGRKSTAGRRGEHKKLNRGICGSRKKLAAACRKVSSHATVAWRKRNLFRRSGIKKHFGRRKELAIA